MKVLSAVSVADYFLYPILLRVAHARAYACNAERNSIHFDAIGNLPSCDGYMYKYALIIDKYAISLRRFFSKLYL